MSKVFYDKLVALEHIDREIDKVVDTKEEKEELWHIIDEYIHHRVLGCILQQLPSHHHEEFLSKFIESPHHEGLLDYLKEKIASDVEGFIKQEVQIVKEELLEVIRGKPKKLASSVHKK